MLLRVSKLLGRSVGKGLKMDLSVSSGTLEMSASILAQRRGKRMKVGLTSFSSSLSSSSSCASSSHSPETNVFGDQNLQDLQARFSDLLKDEKKTFLFQDFSINKTTKKNLSSSSSSTLNKAFDNLNLKLKLNEANNKTTPLSCRPFRQNGLPSMSPMQRALSRHSHLQPRRCFSTTPPRHALPILPMLVYASRWLIMSLPLLWRWKVFTNHKKKTQFLLFLIACLLLTILIMAIDQTPFTGRYRFVFLDHANELEAGEEEAQSQYQAFAGRILPDEDPRYDLLMLICVNLLEQFDDRLKKDFQKRKGAGASSEDPGDRHYQAFLESREWKLILVNDPTVNAFVLPTGHIFVFTGILDVAKNDPDFVATILAHEISHVAMRHGSEGISMRMVISAAFDLLRGAALALVGFSFPLQNDLIAGTLNFLDETVSGNAYNRKLEAEADAVGLEFMARAGYNPERAPVFWELMDEKIASVSDVFFSSDETTTEKKDEKKTDDKAKATDKKTQDENNENEEDEDVMLAVPEWISTHPSNPTRIENLKRLLPKTVPLYQEAKKHNLPHKKLIFAKN